MKSALRRMAARALTKGTFDDKAHGAIARMTTTLVSGD